MNKFAIILGEPNSINSEILAKSIASKKKCIIIGNFNLLDKQLRQIKSKVKLYNIKNINDLNNSKNTLNILDVPLKFNHPFNVPIKQSSKYILKCFDIAHDLALKGIIKGFINCSVNKKNIFKNKDIGITEFLGRKNRTKNLEVMMIYNKQLSVSPITTHIKIKDVSKSIKKNIIIDKINILNNYYTKYFNKKPRIGVLGLNPHNYEFRKNSEEAKIIFPSIKILKKKIKLSGPLSSDTVFLKENFKNFDVIVGMYHDQVLSPFKTLFKFDAVNITLGLPYVRLSPDHGTGYEKKGLNISDPKSLNECIKTILKIKKK